MAQAKRTTKEKIKPVVKAESKADETLAVVELSGKQHLLRPGDVLVIDNQNKKAGDKLESEKVLLGSSDSQVSVGQPYLNNAHVVFEVLENLKGKKIEIIKYKAKSRYRRHTGYRSFLTRVKVTAINF